MPDWNRGWKIAISGDRVLVFNSNEPRWAVCDFRKGLSTIISPNGYPAAPLLSAAFSLDFQVISVCKVAALLSKDLLTFRSLSSTGTFSSYSPPMKSVSSLSLFWIQSSTMTSSPLAAPHASQRRSRSAHHPLPIASVSRFLTVGTIAAPPHSSLTTSPDQRTLGTGRVGATVTQSTSASRRA